MARILRKIQKIFCGTQNTNQLTVFGTAKNTNPTYSTDVSNIQSDTYSKGWTPSLVNDLAPFLTDSNSLHYVETSQLAYLFQEGIAEYEANTEYHKGSLIKVISGDYVNIYKSVANNNTGHATNDTNYWSLYIADSNMAHYPIGDLRMSLSTSVLDNEVILDGRAVSRTQYSKLFALFGITYGSGNGSTTFNLPNFTNRTVWGTTSSFGYMQAGLPNIEGDFEGASQNSNHTSGAFYVKGKITKVKNDGEADNWYGFDASRSNPIYGNSTTVQPPAVKVIFKTRWY